MRIKQAKYDCIIADNITIINNIPDFNKLQKELKDDINLKLTAELSESETEGKKLELFAFLDHSKLLEKNSKTLLDILEKISKISGYYELILNFNEENNQDISVTIYDSYIE